MAFLAEEFGSDQMGSVISSFPTVQSDGVTPLDILEFNPIAEAAERNQWRCGSNANSE